MSYKFSQKLFACSMAASALLISACSDNDSNRSSATEVASSTSARFDVQIVNLTNAQPLSPPAMIVHTDGYKAFVDGEAASLGLEMLAEGGDNDQLLSEAQSATEYITSFDAQSPVGPRSQSNSYSFSVPAESLSDAQLTIVSMLVHTNDGFSALDAYALNEISVGSSVTLSLPTWDSGTEANTEASDTIPGPSFGGEGFNATQDDGVSVVRFHPGIVGNTQTEDGLPTSILGELHRFDNPTMRVILTRVN